MSIALIDVRRRGGYPVYPSWHKSRGKPRASLGSLQSASYQVWHHWGAQVGLLNDEDAIRRARRVPYHVSVFRHQVVFAWDLGLRTWHAGPLNDGIGIGIVGYFSAEPGDERDDPEDFREAIVVAWSALQEIAPDTCRRIITHSQGSRKIHDPGAAVARMLAGLAPDAVDPDWSLAPGRPWRPSWRP